MIKQILFQTFQCILSFFIFLVVIQAYNIRFGEEAGMIVFPVILVGIAFLTVLTACFALLVFMSVKDRGIQSVSNVLMFNVGLFIVIAVVDGILYYTYNSIWFVFIGIMHLFPPILGIFMGSRLLSTLSKTQPDVYVQNKLVLSRVCMRLYAYLFVPLAIYMLIMWWLAVRYQIY